MRRCRYFAFVAVSALFVALSVAETGAQTIKEKYSVLQIGTFKVEKGVEPPESFAKVQEEVLKETQEANVWKQVVVEGQQPAEAGAAVLRVEGTIVSFNPGSRAARYVGGVGFGAAQISGRVRYVDANSGEIVADALVNGAMQGGIFGGDPNGVTKKFAEALALNARCMALRTAAGPQSGNGHLPESAAVEGVETTTLEILLSNPKEDQPKLDELTAKGFRLAEFVPTGTKTASLRLERTAKSGEQYQYRLLHNIVPGRMEKSLGEASKLGYRLIPHTFGFYTGVFSIAEKDPGASPATYEYRIHLTQMLSNTEKDIRQDQSQGYVLVDVALVPAGGYVSILEKLVTK